MNFKRIATLAIALVAMIGITTTAEAKWVAELHWTNGCCDEWRVYDDQCPIEEFDPGTALRYMVYICCDGYVDVSSSSGSVVGISQLPIPAGLHGTGEVIPVNEGNHTAGVRQVLRNQMNALVGYLLITPTAISYQPYSGGIN